LLEVGVEEYAGYAQQNEFKGKKEELRRSTSIYASSGR
jgi:hypothetical protein